MPSFALQYIYMKPTRLLTLLAIGIIAMLVILTAGFVTVYARATEKQLSSYGQSILESNIRYTDTVMESTKDLLDDISLDSDVSVLLNYDEVSASDLLRGLRRLYKYTSSNYFIDSIYIYNRKQHTVYVSSPHIPEAVYDISEFPDPDAATTLNDYQAVRNMEPIFRTYHAFHPTVSDIPYLSFLRYNTLSKADTSNVIMVNIKEALLTNLLTEDSQTSLLLVDSNKFCRLLSGSPAILSDDMKDGLLAELDKGSHEFTRVIQGRKCLINTGSVLHGHATLVLVADEGAIAHETRTKSYGFTSLLIGFLFVCSLCLIILLFRFIWRANQAQLEAIERAHEEKQRMLESGKRGRVLAFLHGESEASVLPDTISELVLAVLVFDSEERRPSKKEFCDALAKNIDPSAFLFATYEDDGRCILATRTGSNVRNLEQQIHKAHPDISLFVDEDCPVPLIRQRYEFLCDAIGYRQFSGPGKMHTRAGIEHQATIEYQIPKATLKTLSATILNLETAKAMEMTESLLHELSACSYQSAQQAFLTLSILLDDSITTLEGNNGLNRRAMSGTLLYQLVHLPFIQQVPSVIEPILKDCEQTIRQTKRNRQNELMERITKITEARYREHDFSINTIATELGMSSAYLGKTFKKASGKTFNEYLLATRMEAAKELLVTSTMPIEEVASTVGFNGIPYFYKLFKTMNGCTPVRYRSSRQG